jgi:hypothetical protein
MRRSGFKRRVYGSFKLVDIPKGVKVIDGVVPFVHQKPRKPLRRTKLRLVGHSTTSELKTEIQAVLRQIGIIRDGGCFLRNFTSEITPQYQKCGGFTKAGDLILQFEHLHSRSNAISFSDSRLGVCICLRHHLYYKKQYPAEYEQFARRFIGEQRSALLDRVRADHRPYKVDLKLELLALRQELLLYKKVVRV